MDLTAIGSAIGSLKATTDIAKGLLSLHTMAEVQSVAVELNGKILDAYGQIFAAKEAQTALVERVRELEGEIARMKDWNAQKQRYKLVGLFPGCMVYALQKSMSEGEPPHYVCTACYQKGERSILQGTSTSFRQKPGTGRSHSVFACPACRAEAVTPYVNVPPVNYYEDITPEG